MRIISIPYPQGHFGRPRHEWTVSRNITEDFPPDIIGDCITEVLSAAIVNGCDPLTEPRFFILTTFEK